MTAEDAETMAYERSTEDGAGIRLSLRDIVTHSLDLDELRRLGWRLSPTGLLLNPDPDALERLHAAARGRAKDATP